MDITNNTILVSQLYMRKQSTYTENRIFPYAKIEDLEKELFVKVRKLAINQKPNHPWSSMDDLEILKSAGLYLRDKIFREVISNLLIHREFANPFPAKLIIEQNQVYIENSNKPHGNGRIDPKNFSPYPKNPTIAKFFKEIGWVDELGSGVRNIYKYNKIYSGMEPEFVEADIFRTIVKLNEKDNPQDNPQDNLQNTDTEDVRITMILEFCKEPRARKEIQEYIKINDREYFRKKYLKPLIKKELLKLTIPSKPTSPNQKYYSNKKILH